jgi:hypothetical protein
MSVIEQLHSAYDYFNTHLHGGSLPSRHGVFGVSICFADIGENYADCRRGLFGWSVRINSSLSGMDTGSLLIRLAHETFHMACWRHDSHDAVFRDFARSKGMEINERGQLVRIVPGGLFERVREAWLGQRMQSAGTWATPSPSRTQIDHDASGDWVAALGLAAVLAVAVLLGANALSDRGDGYEYSARYFDDY